MCGFMGRIGADVDVNRGLPWLRRRGPDSQHMWSTADSTVTLLHCRLSIVDDHGRSDQPFHDRDSGIVVALNGEIYNYRSLRKEFQNFPFRTESDTEVIVAAYVKEGIKGFERLNGTFSFVLVDERRERIFLARDAVGKKPLFTLCTPGSVLFGSSLLPLVACSRAEISLNPEAAAFYWRRSYISPDASAVKEVRPVPPGTVLEFHKRGVQLCSTSIHTRDVPRYGGETTEAVDARIGTLLKEAVRLRLENNPNPVALLSGGIDSTIVAQIANDCLNNYGDDRRLRVVTLGALVPYTQDEYYARYAAKQMGLALEIVRPAHERLADAVRRAVSLQDEPLGMPGYFFLFQLIAAVSPHGKVLLTGDGGDEVFLGYRPVTDWRSRELEPGDESQSVEVGPGASPWMSSWARDVTGNTLLGHMFTKVDRASAEQGIEVRCPLLDLSLMHYVRSLPPEIICAETSLKYLLKRQLSGWPRWFIERSKLGLAYNLRWHWAMSRFSGLREMISREAIAAFGENVPPALRAPPQTWTTRDIFQHFGPAWRLMIWSAFLERLAVATRQDSRAAELLLAISARRADRIGI